MVLCCSWLLNSAVVHQFLSFTVSRNTKTVVLISKLDVYTIPNPIGESSEFRVLYLESSLSTTLPRSKFDYELIFCFRYMGTVRFTNA